MKNGLIAAWGILTGTGTHTAPKPPEPMPATKPAIVRQVALHPPARKVIIRTLQLTQQSARSGNSRWIVRTVKIESGESQSRSKSNTTAL